MTKKDYVLIASVLKKMSDDDFMENYVWQREMVDLFADALQAKNTKFNRKKFLIACGVEIENKTFMGQLSRHIDKHYPPTKM